jgi:hypothetical protein
MNKTPCPLLFVAEFFWRALFTKMLARFSEERRTDVGSGHKERKLNKLAEAEGRTADQAKGRRTKII